MNKMTREQFLSLPAGIVYLEQSTHDIGFAIKGPSGVFGSFRKQVVRPNDKGKVSLGTRTQVENDQAEFYVLDDVETMACKSLIFDQLVLWTPEQFQANVLRLMETFTKMANVRIKLPNGEVISGDGSPLSTVTGPTSIN